MRYSKEVDGKWYFECWCPCLCGCIGPDFVMNESGLCPDCEKGNHEIPPAQTKLVSRLIPLHESILAQYRKLIAEGYEDGTDIQES